MITARDSPSPPLTLLVRLNSFRFKWRVSTHHLEPRGAGWVESAFDAWQVLREKKLREWWEVEDGVHHSD